MRPGAGFDAAPSRPPKQSDLTPTTFFLTRDPNSRPLSTESDTLPVRPLLKDTFDFNITPSSPCRPRSTRPQPIDQSHTNNPPQSQTLSDPTNLSLPTSPHSLSSRSCAKSDNSEQDETGSQAITSSEDEQDPTLSAHQLGHSPPQLIMPSIKMPTRRPFTDRGRKIGRFRILVTGSQASGRTSLIKSIVQLCEDIVHLDSPPTGSQPKLVQHPETSFHEIYASTKSYPSWWSDMDESRLLKRRKSVGDAVLERNICFVDTSGSGRADPVLHYIEQQLIRSLDMVHQTEHELTALLSGRGGSQVDLVLYLLTKDQLSQDCHNIRRINELCNVIPLISKVDLLLPHLIRELKNADLPDTVFPSLPYNPTDEAGPRIRAPYSISSANGNDPDNENASLLMSPEYICPLIQSELTPLVQHLFDPNIITHLRYSSAKKMATWYAAEPRMTHLPSSSSSSPPSAQPSTLNSPLVTSLSNSAVLVPPTSEFSLNTSNSYTLARVADHTQREEHLAQLRLSKWASNLQLSLQRERERYQALARNERALWLRQQMSKEVHPGQLVTFHHPHHPELNYIVHDPLGLLRWQHTLRTTGWLALQIVGSFGVVGGMAIWLALGLGVGPHHCIYRHIATRE